MFKPWLALSICLAIVFPAIDSTTASHATNCKVAGGQSGALKYSGQVGSISARVCGNEIWKLLPKPKKPVKKKPSSKPSKKVTWKNEITAVPRVPGFLRSNTGTLSVGESIDLTALAKVHTKNALLLWYPTQVRFHPKVYFWDFGDGTDSQSKYLAHYWSRTGTYSVKLSVGYSVDYRIVGKSGWILLPGLITAKATPQLVQVGESGSGRQRAVLVHWNCLERIQAVGC